MSELGVIRTADDSLWTMVPAPLTRAWMDATPSHYTNRCHPLRAANALEWWLQPAYVTRVYREHGSDLIVVREGLAESHFGSGILTFRVPWAFQAPRGTAVDIRGPSNFFVEGAHACRGVVDTRALSVTFTMNWYIEPGREVTFGADQPVAALSLVSPGRVMACSPTWLGHDATVIQETMDWAARRDAFKRARRSGAVKERAWQGDYFVAAQRRRKVRTLSPLSASTV